MVWFLPSYRHTLSYLYTWIRVSVWICIRFTDLELFVSDLELFVSG